MKSVIYSVAYSYYIKFIRYKIYKINNIKDIIYIFKNISFFYKNADSNIIMQIIIDSLNYYPLNEIELQKLSLLQQNYDMKLGIENYSSFILWVSCIQYIIESNNKKNNILLLK
tara:strand:- start:128 stop:469 length:342 start_codon:yes stop_codon:yes gene_type:complete